MDLGNLGELQETQDFNPLAFLYSIHSWQSSFAVLFLADSQYDIFCIEHNPDMCDTWGDNLCG
jgi:hypothetical protein